MKIKTGTWKTPNGWCAYFTIGDQTYNCQTVSSERLAEWYKRELDRHTDAILLLRGNNETREE